MMWSVLLTLLASSQALAAPQAAPAAAAAGGASSTSSAPTVQLPIGKATGYSDVVNGVQLDHFLGMPFAQAPVGQLRFAKPQPLKPSPRAAINATQYGSGCTTFGGGSEDCLFFNVIRPSGIDPRKKLPVVHWIYGGAFFTGNSAWYDGSQLVAASVKAGKPVIFTSSNYRVGAHGFISSTDFANAAAKNPSKTTLNAGLYDQRFALEFLNQNVAAFGGNPAQKTIFGQSAGAISIAAQLVANRGQQGNLFQSAFMMSGSPNSCGPMPATHPRLDTTWEQLLSATGCSTAADTVECLRAVPSAQFGSAALGIIGSFLNYPSTGNLAWAPVIDREFYNNGRASQSISNGWVADVPIMSSDANDEGTVLVNSAIPTDETAFENYFRSYSIINDDADADAVVQQILSLYPADPAVGSPFANPATDVSQASADPSVQLFQPSTNQFRRQAAVFGDFVFQAPRRFLLSNLAKQQASHRRRSPIWSYIFRQIDEGTPAANGAAHGSDIPYILNPGKTTYTPMQQQMTRSFISFATMKDPTKLDNLDWPQYGTTGVMQQWKGDNVTLVHDDYRAAQLAFWYSPTAAKVFGN